MKVYSVDRSDGRDEKTADVRVKRETERGHWTRLPADDGARETEKMEEKERKEGEGERAEREAEASSSPRRISRARRESRERVL